MKLVIDPVVMRRLYGDARAWQIINDRYVASAALAAWCASIGHPWFIAIAVVA